MLLASYRTCEDPDQPLHAAGIQRYQRYNQAAATSPRDGAASDLSPPARLDRAADLLGELLAGDRDTFTYHAFVLAALPTGGETVCAARGVQPAVVSPAQGLGIAVLVDDETPDDPGVAVKIGGELAAAAERWASLRRTASTSNEAPTEE